MKQWTGLLLALLIGCAPVVHAGLFGESDEEKEARVAKHVADVLREPNKIIALAQEAVERGDIEEGIRLFRKAQTALEAVEVNEDTRGSAFAPLRLKKFHCVSMLDALALKQSEVMDVRQTVTDTSDLAARLAQERAALIAEADAKENQNQLPKPPTLVDQLAIEEGKLMQAQAAAEQHRASLQQVKRTAEAAEKAFAEIAQMHAAADTRLFMAEQAVQQAEREGKSKEEIDALKEKTLGPKRELEAVKTRLHELKEKQQVAKQALATVEERTTAAEAALAMAQQSVTDLRQAIADEKAAEAKKIADAKAAEEAERQRLAAETLKRKQAEAAAAARQREAMAKAAAAQDAAAKAKAEADAKALAKELQICEELWRMKRVESFEEHVVEALAKWPDEPQLMLHLARLRLIQGQEDDALELVSMIADKGEIGKKAAFVAAGAYMVKGLPMEAMKILEPLEKQSPKDPDVCYNMAIVLVRLPEVDPTREIAAQYYTRSVELGGKRSLVLERRLNME